jgi:c-di-GMP-related signal transduction protein
LPSLLEVPLPYVVSRLPLAEDIRKALLGSRNRVAKVHELVLAYENGYWETCYQLALGLGLTEAEMSSCYFQAALWAGAAGGDLPVHGVLTSQVSSPVAVSHVN